MALTLDLNKAQTALTLSLSKAGLITPPTVDVVFVLDVSGSFDDEHQEGVTNDLLTRLIPWAATFDPDQKMEVYTFSNNNNVYKAPDVTTNNYDGYVAKHVIGCPGYNGGTDYAPVLNRISKDYAGTSVVAATKGFFGFGKKAAVDTPNPGKPVLVFFVTDGDNNDKGDTLRAFKAMEAKVPNIYVQFLGVSNQTANFPFIDQLGEEFGNVGFTAVNKVRDWVKKSDDQVNEALISQELIDWLKG